MAWAGSLWLLALVVSGCATNACDDGVAVEERVLREALSLYRRQGGMSFPDECLLVVVHRNDESGRFIVDVRERHDWRCGGDPAVAPRLATVVVEGDHGCNR
jgi:hypothetical protein